MASADFQRDGDHHQLTSYEITTDANEIVRLGPNGEAVHVPSETWANSAVRIAPVPRREAS